MSSANNKLCSTFVFREIFLELRNRKWQKCHPGRSKSFISVKRFFTSGGRHFRGFLTKDCKIVKPFKGCTSTFCVFFPLRGAVSTVGVPVTVVGCQDPAIAAARMMVQTCLSQSPSRYGYYFIYKEWLDARTRPLLLSE